MKTLKQHIRKLSKDQFKELTFLTFESRKLYNCALYVTKGYFKETNSYIGYLALYHEMKHDIHYKNLPAQVAQQILRLVDKDFRSFFALLKRKRKGTYLAKIREPGFKRKDSQFILPFPSQLAYIKKNVLKLTRSLKIPFTYEIDGYVKQIIVIPDSKKYFTICIQYDKENKKKKKEKKEQLKLDKDNILGIDLGLNNLAACLSTNGTSLIVNGRPLKSINQRWNKRKAKVQSELEIKNKKKHSNKLKKMSINRSNKVNNYMSQSVALIVKHCQRNNIGSIVIGYNKGWKQGINLGKRNNQSFVNIPFHAFKRKLEHKCMEREINFKQQEESYTSKCSFLDEEDVKNHDSYLGKRVKRGLFKALSGQLCNADVQSAGNIVKKAFPKAGFANGMERCIVQPEVFNIC